MDGPHRRSFGGKIDRLLDGRARAAPRRRGRPSYCGEIGRVLHGRARVAPGRRGTVYNLFSYHLCKLQAKKREAHLKDEHELRPDVEGKLLEEAPNQIQHPTSQSGISSGQDGNLTPLLHQRSHEEPSLDEGNANSYNGSIGWEVGMPEPALNGTIIEVNESTHPTSQSGITPLLHQRSHEEPSSDEGNPNSHNGTIGQEVAIRIEMAESTHPTSQSGISSGQDGNLTPLLHQRSHEEPSSDEGNPNSHNGTIGQEVAIRIETAESTATLEDLEIVKHARKVAYWTSTLSVGGIISIVIGFAGAQVTQAYSLHLKICLLFLVASFISAAFLILPDPRRSATDRTMIVRALEYTTVGGLVVAILDVSFIFLKLFVLIIGVPFLFFLLLAFLLRCRSTIRRTSFGV